MSKKELYKIFQEIERVNSETEKSEKIEFLVNKGIRLLLNITFPKL